MKKMTEFCCERSNEGDDPQYLIFNIYQYLIFNIY
jgi:hypothetical protein